MDILLLIIGLGLILAGANFLTDGSAALAQRFRVPEFIIGLTVVAVGTSTPELVVSVLSAIAGKSDVAIGNVVGSNIFNVFVILGVCALIRPLPLTAGNIRRDIPFGVIVSLLLLALAADSYVFKGAADRIGRIDGIVMLLLYGALMWYTIRTTKRPEATAPDAGAKPGMAGWLMAAMIVGGLAGLIFGGEMFLRSATEIARRMCDSGEELRFYACGGDGTVNEVANGIIGYDNAAMTVIPVGTGNDFLKNFGDDLEKFRDAENLWDGPQFPIDAIDVNGRIALTIACSGIDARVARDVHKYSESPLLDGKSSYIYSLAVNFLFKGIGSHWTVSLDDTVMEGDWSLVAVCNGRYYGGGFMPVAEARMDDGVLNTLVVKQVTRRAFTRFVAPYSKGEYWRFPQYAQSYTAKEIRITSDEDIVTCLDGEIFRFRDVTFRLSDKKLNFFAPKGASPDATFTPIDQQQRKNSL